MFKKETHREPLGGRGNFDRVVTAGFGTPYARPTLTAWTTLGFAPNGLDLVSSPSIAVGIDKNGYLVPAGTKSGNNGKGADAKELVVPFGVIAQCLRSTKTLAATLSTDGSGKDTHLIHFPGVNVCNGQMTGMDDLHGLTPTVFQNRELFQRGYAFDTEKTGYCEILDFKVGDLLRPIHEGELAELINQDVILPLFGEEKTNCPKTKAYFAGMPVKYNGKITGKDAEAGDVNKQEFIIGRVAAVQDARTWNNYIYAGNDCFDYHIQGRDTLGASENVWNSIEPAFDSKTKKLKENFKAIAVEFYVNM